MPSPEDRIITMQFDNKKFEANVATTMGTLDKLKIALKFEGVKTGLNDVSFESKKFEQKLADSGSMIDKFKTALGFGGTRANVDGIPVDNRKFEENLAGSVTAIDRFKIALGFSNVKTGFSDIEKASKGVTLSGITTAIDNVSGKFTAMSAVAFTALQNITNRVIDTGIQFAKSLSLDQTISGFKEYEQNMNAIQTILSNTKGDNTNLEDVNKALDELNTYSDQTIYNFGEMTKNIGTFTAAGIDLDTSVSAIKGIANLAAISGSSSDQASSAMYQLSQALASGSLKLMDWNSVVNAGMGGEVFQKALFETGKAMGTIADVDMATTFDDWKAAGNTFRASLEDGWVTGEVLTNTLQGFTGDLTEAQIMSLGYTAEQTKGIMEMGQTGKDAATKVKTLTQLISTVKESIGSGWSASFRTIFGDFEEAKTLFTDVSNAIGSIVGKSADARNALLQGWKDMGGRTLLIQALGDAFRALATIFNTIKGAFQEIFPPMTSERLFELTQRFAEFTKKLMPSEGTLDAVKRVFKGLFAALKIGTTIVKEVFGVFTDLFDRFAGSDNGKGGLLGFLAGLGDKIVKLKETLVDGGAISAFFDNIPGKIASFVGEFEGIFASFDSLKQKLKQLWGAFTLGFNGIDLSGIGGPLTGFVNQIGILVGSVKDFFTSGEDPALDTFGSKFTWLTGIVDGLKGAFGFLIDVLSGAKDRLGDIGGYIADQFGGLDDKISGGLKGEGYDKTLDTLNTGIFAAIAIAFTGFLNNGFGVTGLVKDISNSFQELTEVLQAMQTNLKAKALLDIAIALALLTASLVVMSMIDSGALTKALIAMSVGFSQLILAMVGLQTITGDPKQAISLLATAAGVLLIAGAMLVLSVAAKILSTMDWDEMAKGLTGILGLMGILAVTIKPLSENEGGLILTGLGLIAIAVAMNILAVAAKIFATMDWDEMIRGLTGIGGALLALITAMQFIPESIFVDSLGVIALAVALNLLAVAVFAFGSMNLGTIQQGVMAIAVGLGLLGGALYLMPPGLILQGLGLLAVSVGLVAMAKAVKDLGEMDPKDLQSGLLGIGIALVGLALGLYMMTGTVAGAIALTIASVGLLALSVALRSFAKLSWKELLVGLAGIAGVFLVIAIGAAALAPLVGPMLALGLALTLLGVAFILFGAGAYLAAMAFSTVAHAGEEGVGIFFALLDGLTTQLPFYTQKLIASIIDFVSGILEALPRLIGSLSDILVALFKLIVENAPELGKALTALIIAGLNILEESFPALVQTGLNLLLSLLKGIKDNIKEIVVTVVELFEEFSNAVVDNMDSVADSGTNMLVAFLNAIAERIQLVIDAGKNIILEFVNGMGSASLEVLNAGSTALLEFLRGLALSIPEIGKSITAVITAITTEIALQVPLVVDAGYKMFIALFDGIAQVIRDNSVEFGRALGGLTSALVKGIGTALKEAIKQIANDLFPGLGTIVSGILDFFGIASPSKLFYWIGEMLMVGLDDGIQQNFDGPVESIEAGSDKILDAVSKTMGAVPSMLENMSEFNPTITPVLDLSDVSKTANQLGSILGVSQMSADLSYGQASALLQASRLQEETAATATPEAPREIRFEQTINAPVALSTSELFRQTRSQLAMAKEELQIT